MRRREPDGSLYYYNMEEKNVDLVRLMPLINEAIALEPNCFFVKAKIKPTNNIKIYLDADDGLPIEVCARVTRKIRKALEENALYAEGEFSLEVSSPGIDEPLVLHRQYIKNINRTVEVTLLSDEVLIGKLLQVTETNVDIEITEGKGKKAIVLQKQIPFEQIKKTVVQIVF